MEDNEPEVAKQELKSVLDKSEGLNNLVTETSPVECEPDLLSVDVGDETGGEGQEEAGHIPSPEAENNPKLSSKSDIGIEGACVAPDIEHIVSSGATQDGTASADTLRELVARARRVTGQAREALPPGFDDDALAQAEQTYEYKIITQAVEASGAAEVQKTSSQDADATATIIGDSHTSKLDAELNVPEFFSPTDASSNEEEDSDEDSSSSSSSEEEEEEGTGTKVIIAGAEDDDDDDDGGGAGTSAAPATKNEILVPEVDLPPVQELNEAEKITIKPLGRLHSIVDSVVVVEQEVHKKRDGNEQKTKPDAPPLDSTGRRGESEGEYSVVDTGSLLCFEDGKVLGLVFETFGSIHSPMYSIRFAMASAIDREVVQIGKPVFYLPCQSTYVMTRHLRAIKGSDASNIYDEEVAEDEIDYSDDEAEAEAKRRSKALRSGKTDESGQPLPKANNRAVKRQKQSNGSAQQKHPQPSNTLPRRNEIHTGLSGRASLPNKPVKGLPTRPTFDHDGAASSSTHRQVLSYGDADAGVRGRPGHRRLSSASIVSLPPKPVSMVSTTPHVHRRQPTLPSVSPPQAQGAVTMSASPISYQMPPTLYNTNGASGWYSAGSTGPGVATAPNGAAYGTQHNASGQAGHYNPQFAAYWQHQQQQAPWYSGSHYQHPQQHHPFSLPHHHQAPHQAIGPSKPHQVQQQPYAYAQPGQPQTSAQWNGYQYPAQYQGFSAPQSGYATNSPAQNVAKYPQQNTPYAGCAPETLPSTFSSYGYGPDGPSPSVPDSYDPRSPSISKTPGS